MVISGSLSSSGGGRSSPRGGGGAAGTGSSWSLLRAAASSRVIRLLRDLHKQSGVLGFLLLKLFFLLDLLGLDAGNFTVFYMAFAGKRTELPQVRTQRVDIVLAGAGKIAVIIQISCNFIGTMFIEQELEVFLLSAAFDIIMIEKLAQP